jgi:hypothetical protein
MEELGSTGGTERADAADIDLDDVRGARGRGNELSQQTSGFGAEVGVGEKGHGVVPSRHGDHGIATCCANG